MVYIFASLVLSF